MTKKSYTLKMSN